MQRHTRRPGTSRRLTLLGAALALGLAGLTTLHSAPAAAIELTADLGSQGQFMTTDSPLAFEQDGSLWGFALRAGAEVVDDAFIELDWITYSAARVLRGSVSAQLDGQTLALSLRMRFPVGDWLEPYGRLGSGVMMNDVTLTDAVAYTSETYSPYVHAAAGVDVLLSRPYIWRKRQAPRPDFTVGMNFELGYGHGFGQDLVLHSDRHLEPDLARDDLKLGTLTLSGVTLRIALTVKI